MKKLMIMLGAISALSLVVTAKAFGPPTLFFPPSTTKALLPFPNVVLTGVEAKPEEITMLTEAILDLNNVLASECFYQDVLHANFSEINTLTNEEIYDYLRFKPIKIKVTMFTGSFSETYVYGVIGYFRPDIPDTIFQNRAYVTNHLEAASNILHEVMHMIGFMHELSFKGTIPYTMNDIFKDCSGQLNIKPD
jgi:hypothetical protein